jgi:hypothetical protein
MPAHPKHFSYTLMQVQGFYHSSFCLKLMGTFERPEKWRQDQKNGVL